MSYIKSCDKCGQRISLRQMSSGQWVAFNAGTDIPHEHYSKKRPTKTDLKKSEFARKNQELDENHIIDRLNEVYSLKKIPTEWLSLTPLNLKKLFNKLIEKERSALISYIDRNDQFTSREIYPLSLVEGYDGDNSKTKYLKIVSYCTLRKDYRTFLLSSIEEILAGDKVPKSFINLFNKLSDEEREDILSGTHFFGSNSKLVEDVQNFEDISDEKPHEGVTTKPKKVQPVKKQRSNRVSSAEVQTKKTSTTMEKKGASGSDYFWFLVICWVLIQLFFSG